MNDNLHTIFSGSGCPTHQQLRDYVDGRLSDSEKHRIEAHLVDCEMCSDEIEGLSLMKDPEQLPAIVEELDHKIAASRHRILRMRSRHILAAAAVIVLLVGAVFILRYAVWQQKDPLISEQKLQEDDTKEEDILRTEFEKTPPPVPESSAEKEEEKRTGDEQQPETVTEQEEIPEPETTSMIVEEIGAENAEPVMDEIVPAKAPEPVPKPDIAMEGISLTDAAGRGEAPAIAGISKDSSMEIEFGVDAVATRSVAGQSKAFRAKRVTSPSAMEQAMLHYQEREYKQASALFEQILKQDSTNFRAVYHLAFCHIELNKVKEARKELEKILADPENEYYAKALILQEKINLMKEENR